MTNQTDKGVIDLVDRVLSMLLSSATFKNNVRILLNNLDPESARRLVRTVMWQDMEFSISWVGASPALINTLIKLVDEVLDQVADKFPEPMLGEFLNNVLSDIDQEALARAREKALVLYAGLAPVFEQKWLEVADVLNRQPAAPESDGRDLPSEVEGRFPPKTDSVLEALLETPFLKTMIREFLADMDPAKGASAARTLMWTDMETMLAVLGTLPTIINFYLHAVAEIGTQMNDKMPPRMLVPFVTDILSDIDMDTVRKGMGAYRKLGGDVVQEAGPLLATAVHDLLTAPAFTSALAEGLNMGLAGLNRLEADHPGTMRDFMAAVVTNTDADTVNTAVRHLSDAVLAQRPPVFVIAWRAVKAYIRGYYRRLFRRR